MHIHELNPPAPPEPPAAWKLQFQRFWREATDTQRIDMRVALAMEDGTCAQRILESWQQGIDERRRSRKSAKKKKSHARRFQYGVYGGWFYPGFHNNSGADSSSDGADGGGGESLREQHQLDLQTVLGEFLQFCCNELDIKDQPRIRLRRDPVWSQRNGTFGRFDPQRGHIELAVANRHPMDVLRTLAHELVHHRQAQDQALPVGAGATGSDYEDEANARAGEIMRQWADKNPHAFLGIDEDFSPDDPPGPETKPTMPQGTVRVDVSDMYDWYKLGQHISNLRGLGRHDFGQGPPSSILSFGDEDLEHKYIQDLKKTGLDVTDIDPASHRRRPGQKTDPTYNVAEASGYIPTAAEKNDPRFSMALTVDVHPGQTGKEANKLGLKTDSQGRPDLLMKKLSNLLESVKLDKEILDEVEMSPSAFQRFLKSPAAEGIRAGFEAELIFRNTQSDAGGGGGDSEPDYDADERAYGIQDIVDFFQGGDNPIGRRAADRLSQELTEQFYDWAREQFANDYFDQDRFMSWAEENVWPDNEDEYREQARDALDDEEISDEELEKQAVQLFRDDVERDWDRSGAWYEMASEELFDEYMGDLDESDWLDQQGLRYMSDVANEYSLDWPYWTEGSGGGERDWQDIGNSLERVTGMPVRVSGGYHGAARREGQYIIEPDSSLDADDSDDYGLEIVSPPMPLPEAVEQLKKVIAWANGAGDAYTNSSTGLHMGVSLPFKGGDVDPIKLILFMGDKNVLETFERQSNTYARSAYERLESKIRAMRNAGPQQIAGVMDLMKKSLIELADREMKSGMLGDKYVSVHPQQGYIEFRGPGGDYLAKEDEIDGVLENTMLRLAYAMSIAGDNAAYRKEYAKKLYKVLTKDDPANPFMRLFAEYSAGDLSAEELKRQWADTVLQAERGDVEDVPNAVPGEYEVYDKDSGTPGDRDSFTVIDTFQSNSDENAMVIAQEKWSGKGVNFGVRAKSAKPEDQKPKSRRAELAKRVTRSTRDVGEQLWRVNHHSSIRWVTARSQAEAVKQAIQQDRAFNSPETRARIATDLEKAHWNLEQERQRERDAERDAAEIRARVGAPQPVAAAANTDIGEPRPNTTRNPDANWAIVRRSNGEIVIPFIRNTQPEALEYFQDWTTSRVGNAGAYQLVPLTADVRTGTPGAGEWTGRWLFRKADTGEVLHTISGIGNSQADANRYAQQWAQREGVGHIPLEVVPEMG